ncbi:Sec63 Brl domain-containing protein [Crepidotus variabilis]|uniref:Sec63 Brl domain-containing protein n=1 Tax=Crepidotus variabilis TaxID=179855 RepID=A0A9P6ERP9_9AGAR|nr:Sec63 Brl domain-containing protein [Crepidotus variabilis]
MSTVLKHVGKLLSASGSSGDKTSGSMNEWECTLNNATNLKARNTPSIEQLKDQEARTHHDSVLEIFSGTVSMESDSSHSFLILHDLLGTSPSKDVAQSLHTILTKRRGGPIDDAVNDVAELVGYERLDLIVELLNHQEQTLSELNRILLHHESHPNRDPLHRIERDGDLFSQVNVRQRLQDQLNANANRPLFSGHAEDAPDVLPHVYSSSTMAQGSFVSQMGSKYMLPIGSERTLYEEYEEVVVPPAKPLPPRNMERLLPIGDLDEIIRGCFAGYTSFNRVQSIVYPTAYTSNENLLICAPTGAGKTEVAMLSILRVINQHRRQTPHPRDGIDRHLFKIIYVAPMKALASEIVRKVGKRLQWLGIEVRELTGDMQLTKAEIAKTQIIVTTPEKWDVVTRKPTGEGEIASVLKLLIIDEVHLLNDERGAVIETIVARTQRQVESSQSMIRIVGLSATLPNYVDVADFLCASRHKGLFYFDSSFRPVPLEQHFLGIRGKPGSLQARKNLDTVTFQKVSELVEQGHQVMVFVHARKETVKTAMTLRETSLLEGVNEQFSCEDHPQYGHFRRQIGESRNKEMKLLFDSGFGIHHAGMLRSDRNLMERLFLEKAIKVLCCTATLAWGVNLPAHAVVIKGTQVYDSSKGKFVDLSVLDVLQIFGRAGRPGMETSGEGFILTTEDKLTHYLDAVTSSIPIESQFLAGIIDSLNAEIALGTVSTVRDAVQWLGYTYLFVRMRRNPFVYGIPRETLIDDPALGGKRNELANAAAKRLVAAKMISFHEAKGRFSITDLGRIAAKYYIRSASIEIFTEVFRPKMSEADVLAMLSKSTEFNQIQLRESEFKELEEMRSRIPCEVKGIDSSADKSNILLQGYISNEMVEDFALVSDMAYVAQNAGRIIRALLEIAISKKWASVSTTLMGLSKAIEMRSWPFENPLRQMKLKSETLYSLERWADDMSIRELANYDPAALGRLVHLNEQHGLAIVNAAKQFPFLELRHHLQPVTPEVLKITIDITPSFDWNPKLHSGETFYVWIEDQKGVNILQLTHIAVQHNTETIKAVFFILVRSGEATGTLQLRWISDRWAGAEDNIPIALDTLIMPTTSTTSTKLIQLPFLLIQDIGGPTLFKNVLPTSKHTLNSIQTQAFWNTVYAKHNSLLSAPMGSGKSTLIQLAAWLAVLRDPKCWVLIVTPSRAVAVELFTDMRKSSEICGIPVHYNNRESETLFRRPVPGVKIVTASVLLDAICKGSPNVRDLRLVVCEALEQLDASYELAISLLLHATQASNTRFVGVASSLADPDPLAKWLRVDHIALTKFRSQDRDQALKISKQTFSIPYSAALFKAMSKPAHRAIYNVLPGSSALVFVPSKGQCRTIAQDLITQCTLETEAQKGYVPEGISDDALTLYARQLRDPSLTDFITQGVGFFHSGIHKDDQALMLVMFAEGVLGVLIAPKDACWDIPIRAHLVIVMGTQFAVAGEQGAARQIHDYSLAELTRMQSRAVQQAQDGHFYLFCQAESLETYSKFLDEGLPLESQLSDSNVVRIWARRFLTDKFNHQGLLNALSFTFLAQRVIHNPSFYGFPSRSQTENLSSIVDLIEKDLRKSA